MHGMMMKAAEKEGLIRMFTNNQDVIEQHISHVRQEMEQCTMAAKWMRQMKETIHKDDHLVQTTIKDHPSILDVIMSMGRRML